MLTAERKNILLVFHMLFPVSPKNPNFAKDLKASAKNNHFVCFAFLIRCGLAWFPSSRSCKSGLLLMHSTRRDNVVFTAGFPTRVRVVDNSLSSGGDLVARRTEDYRLL